MFSPGSSNVWRILKRSFHVLMLAFMLGISNAILQEQRFIDDSATVIEMHDEAGDDDPYD